MLEGIKENEWKMLSTYFIIFMIVAFSALAIIAAVESRFEFIIKEGLIIFISIAIIVFGIVLALIAFYAILRLKETTNKLIISDKKIEELENELERLKKE